MRNKRSFGLACCCRRNGVPVVLLERRRVSYDFVEFVLGKYPRNDSKKIQNMLNNMTVDEKLDILSLDFEKIWYRFKLETEDYIKQHTPTSHFDSYEYYNSKLVKFETTFVLTNAKYNLVNMINKSTDAELLWEIPKGRREPNERDLDAAMRELREEAGVTCDEYTILFDVKPVYHSFQVADVIYTTCYYMAETTQPIDTMSFSKKQHLEINALRWFSMEQLRALGTHQALQSAVPALKKYKSYSKKRRRGQLM